MRIVIAPDSFKGCLTALEVCQAAAEGISAIDDEFELVQVPMADGGEGTVQSLVDATDGQLITERVTGPLGEPVEATYGLLGDGETAVIEMAAASGLPLVPQDRRDPLTTTTYGTGELMRAALDRGRRKLIVGIGGSATTDAGAGMAQALGVRLLDEDGEEIGFGGAELGRLAAIEMAGADPRLNETEVRVACDVDNPLYGERGAAHVYSPQKGASLEDVELLDENLRLFADVVQRDLGLDVRDIPGAGAAGGLGAGLVAFCGATLEPGVEIVIDAVDLPGRMRGADLCITGEGAIDSQTAFGKTPAGVTSVAEREGAPVIAIGGGVALDAVSLHERGFEALACILNRPMALSEAMRPEVATEMIAFTAQQMVRCFLAARGAAQPHSTGDD
ncbi:MAG: glycerate kinase [Armatimonadota bacterium]|nr:glycerate kinase [Armatimonadota bacterium]